MAKKKQDTPGAIIARLREAAGWTRYRLAQESGTNEIQLSRIERGLASLKLETARRIVAALGESLAVFDAE